MEQLDVETAFTCNGARSSVDAPADESLLLVLRERLGIVSVKDGCAPQGQCGCCTVLVDGEPRVACVTPVARVAGRVGHDGRRARPDGARPARRVVRRDRRIAVRVLHAGHRHARVAASASATSIARWPRTCAGAPAGARCTTRFAATARRSARA